MPRKKKQPEILKVENNPDLIRDTANSAIINTNEDAFAARKAQIQAAKEKKTIDKSNNRIFCSFKAMLQKLSKCYRN